MRHRAVAIAIIGLCLLGGCAAQRTIESSPERSPVDDQGSRDLIGSWHTTSGERSLVISIRDDGHALVLFMQPGQHSIKHVTWKSFHGGILIQDVTRLRLWPGRHAGELRAEFEADPRDKGEDGFPASFFMARVSESQVPAELLNRPVPAQWRRSQVDEAWDSTAGKR